MSSILYHHTFNVKTIALIDTTWNGHHPTYLKLFSKTLLELGHRVIAFCPEPIEMSKWVSINCPNKKEQFTAVKMIKPKQSQFPIKRLRSTCSALTYWWRTARTIRNETSGVGSLPDLTFFAYIDVYLGFLLIPYIVDRIFHYRWSGLCFHPTHLRMPQRFLFIRRGPLNPVALLKSPWCQSIAVLDEGIAEKLQDKISSKKVVVFPDVMDESPPDMNYAIVKQIQEKAQGMKIVSLLGSLERRKGLLTLLKIAQSEAAKDWFFVFAGELADRSFLPKDLVMIEAITKSAPPNCFFHFGRIPDEYKFNALVNASDVLFAAYEKFYHSSGILTKAAYFEKFVIVSKGCLMEERVHEFKLGLSIQANNVPQGIKALRMLCNNSESSIRQLKANFEGYKRLHSMRRLNEAFQIILNT